MPPSIDQREAVQPNLKWEIFPPVFLFSEKAVSLDFEIRNFTPHPFLSNLMDFS